MLYNSSLMNALVYVDIKPGQLLGKEKGTRLVQSHRLIFFFVIRTLLYYLTSCMRSHVCCATFQYCKVTTK